MSRLINALLVFEQGSFEAERGLTLDQLDSLLDTGLVEEDQRLTSITLYPYVPLVAEPDPHRDPPPPTSLVEVVVQGSTVTPDLTMLGLASRNADEELETYLLTRADLETLYRLIGTRIASLP